MYSYHHSYYSSSSSLFSSSPSSEDQSYESSLQYDNDGYVIVYIDGCCLNNGKSYAQAGIGVWFDHGFYANVSKPVHGPATNQNAEIQAATAAFRKAQSLEIENMRLYTDSMYLINCMTDWINVWKQNGWRKSNGDPLANEYSLKECYHAQRTWEGQYGTVDYEHVDAHSGIEGNEEADALARGGALQY